MVIALAEDLAPAGIRDLRAGVESYEALLTLIGAPRLRELGFEAPESLAPESRLFEILAETYGDAAHSQYNSLIGELVDYERSVGRAQITPDVLREFMRGVASSQPIYMTGDASALVLGLRATARNINLMTEDDAALRAIADTRDRLNISVKRSTPGTLVPPLRGWEQRCAHIAGSFHHFDFYSQCLSKLERGHRKDLDDIASMVREHLVDPKKLLALFREVESELYRYPVLDPPTLRARVEAFALQ